MTCLIGLAVLSALAGLVGGSACVETLKTKDPRTITETNGGIVDSRLLALRLCIDASMVYERPSRILLEGDMPDSAGCHSYEDAAPELSGGGAERRSVAFLTRAASPGALFKLQ